MLARVVCRALRGLSAQREENMARFYRAVFKIAHASGHENRHAVRRAQTQTKGENMQKVHRCKKRPPGWKRPMLDLKIKKNDFRTEYEVFDDGEKLRGFVWMFDGGWHVRVDDHAAEHFSTLPEATNRAHDLVFGHPGC